MLDRRSTLLGQGVYYGVTGIWPFVSLGSFLAITGPKREIWLLKTVSVLVGVIGAVLLSGAKRQPHSREMTVLAGGSALGLGAIDVVYVAQRRISPVYLVDAVLQALFCVLLGRTRKEHRTDL